MRDARCERRNDEEGIIIIWGVVGGYELLCSPRYRPSQRVSHEKTTGQRAKNSVIRFVLSKLWNSRLAEPHRTERGSEHPHQAGRCQLLHCFFCVV
jgi:hypothetical protein